MVARNFAYRDHSAPGSPTSFSTFRRSFVKMPVFDDMHLMEADAMGRVAQYLVECGVRRPPRDFTLRGAVSIVSGRDVVVERHSPQLDRAPGRTCHTVGQTRQVDTTYFMRRRRVECRAQLYFYEPPVVRRRDQGPHQGAVLGRGFHCVWRLICEQHRGGRPIPHAIAIDGRLPPRPCSSS